MKVVFIAEEFQLRTPVQQLLDRFLLGWPDRFPDAFKKGDWELTLVTAEKNSEIERRMKDFGLVWQNEPVSADAAMIFTRSITSLPAARSFIYGAPRKGVAGVVGTAVRGAWLLPSLSPRKLPRFDKALAIVQGEYPTAEIEALDALLPLIWSSTAPKIRSITHLGPNNFWDVLKRDFWPLVKSAISRSDSPQGDPVRDGRTQDLVGLGLLEGLVKAPRGWLIEIADGSQYVIAVMDGALADYNVALQTRAGGIISAQVYRPPPPAQHHYSRLAAMLEHYFQTGLPPWPVEQTHLTAELLQRFDAALSLHRSQGKSDALTAGT